MKVSNELMKAMMLAKLPFNIMGVVEISYTLSYSPQSNLTSMLKAEVDEIISKIPEDQKKHIYDDLVQKKKQKGFNVEKEIQYYRNILNENIPHDKALQDIEKNRNYEKYLEDSLNRIEGYKKSESGIIDLEIVMLKNLQTILRSNGIYVEKELKKQYVQNINEVLIKKGFEFTI